MEWKHIIPYNENSEAHDKLHRTLDPVTHDAAGTTNWNFISFYSCQF